MKKPGDGLRLPLLFRIYIISIWANFPFATILGGQFRFEIVTLPILLYFLRQNREFLGISHATRTLTKLPMTPCLLIGANLISSIYFALAPLQSLWMLSQILNGTIVFYALAKVDNKYSLFLIASKTTFVLFVFFLIYSVLVLSSILSDQLNMFNQLNRFKGLSFESNILASQALFWIFVEIKYRNITKPFQNKLIIFLISTIFLSQTRAAIVCLFVLLLVSIWRKSLAHPIGIIQIILICSISLLLGTVDFHHLANNYSRDSLQGRMIRLVDLNSETVVYRKKVTDIALEDINNSRFQIQLFGSGTNSFKQHHNIDISGVEDGYISSLWVQILYDSGLIGLILILIFFFNQFRNNAKGSLVGKTFYVSIFLTAGATNMIWFTYLWLSLSFFTDFRTPSSPDFQNHKFFS